MAQSVKHQTLDFGSCHDLTVCEICAEHRACLGFSLPPSLSATPLLMCARSFSFKINIKKKKKDRFLKKGLSKPSFHLSKLHLEVFLRGIKAFFIIYLKVDHETKAMKPVRLKTPLKTS